NPADGHSGLLWQGWRAFAIVPPRAGRRVLDGTRVAVRFLLDEQGKTMRKVSWRFAGVTLLAAAICCLGAELTYRYPNTRIGRCVIATHDVAARFNPAYRFSQFAFRKTSAVVHHVENALTTPATSTVPSETAVIPDDPRPLAVEEPVQAACPAPMHIIG